MGARYTNTINSNLNDNFRSSDIFNETESIN